jgi:hypothetical protein
MRSRGVIVGALLVSVTAGAAVASAEPRPRAVRAVQQDAELGLTTQTAIASDGALVVTAQAAGLTIDKRVYSDGRFDVRIAIGTNDRVVIAADADGISVATAHEATIRLNPAGDGEYEPRARRVRGWLAASAAVGRFRQLVDALERRGGRDPEALSLRATGALVAELLGDPGAARRFGERVAGGGAGFRKAQQYTQSCWTSISAWCSRRRISSRVASRALPSTTRCGRCAPPSGFSRSNRPGSSFSVARRFH